MLTKRPERMREYLTWDYHGGVRADEVAPPFIPDVIQWPLPNVWLGTSTENQRGADIRVPELLATPAAVRFLSCEPLLGPLDLQRLSTGPMTEKDALLGWVTKYSDYKPAAGEPPMSSDDCEARSDPGHRIDWVIVGGESGPKARPCDLAWLRGIVEQCRAAGVACFVKQLGARPFTCDSGEQFGDRGLGGLKSRKGSDMGEWPEDLRVREMPVAAWNA